MTEPSDQDLAGATYRDGDAEIEDRVEDLLARMTLPEKLAQLGGVWSTSLVRDVDGTSSFSPDAASSEMTNGTGQITRIAASTGLRPTGLASLYNEIQRWLVEQTRLGIPAILHEETVGGFCARDAVQFPQSIGLASTWDVDLVGDIGAHIRSEMLAVGARQALAPVLDVARDPRWGRVEETYGEDPILAGTLGVAYIRGLQAMAEQSPDETTRSHLHDGVVATAKHFLGYGLSDGALNHGPVHVGSRELREVYAEPFAAAVRDSDLASVMNSYSSVDGLAPAGSRAMLTDLLRDEIGFGGTVVADYFAVALLETHHRVAPNKAVAAAKAIIAGLDVELPTLDCFAELPPLVDAGVVPEALIDLSVRRVLRQKFALGLFESPYVDESMAAAAFGTPEGRTLARRAAAESMVLLTNSAPAGADTPILPLDISALQTIAVIGPAADDVRLTQGDYHYPAHLEILGSGATEHDQPAPAGGADLLPRAGGAFEPGAYFPDTVTPYAGLVAAFGPTVRVEHARGCEVSGDDRSGFADAVALAAGSDVAVVCLGGRSGLTPDATVGEARDATDLDLTGVQLELLRAVRDSGTPVVTVVVSGRVHTLAEIEQLSDATVLAWLPGVETGSALADMLSGEVAPSGRLPVSLPRNVGQLPVHYNHRAGGGRSQFWGDYTDSPASPLHRFGFGLSTTRFEYSEPVVHAGTTTEPTTVDVAVTNTGSRRGVEVVQYYVHDEVASVARPERQLVGFTRVDLAPGMTARLRCTLHPSRLAFHDEDFDLVCEPGAFRVEIGGHAGAPARSATFDLTGEVESYRYPDIVATAITDL